MCGPIPFVPAWLVIRIEHRPLGPPPWRFTLRRLMIVVALVGVWLALASHAARLRQMGRIYADEALRLAWETDPPGIESPDHQGRTAEQYADLCYEHQDSARRIDRLLRVSLIVATALSSLATLSALLRLWGQRRSPP